METWQRHSGMPRSRNPSQKPLTRSSKAAPRKPCCTSQSLSAWTRGPSGGAADMATLDLISGIAPIPRPGAAALFGIPAIGFLEAFPQTDPGLPAQRIQPSDIQPFARRAVRLGSIERQLALEPNHITNRFNQFADCHILTNPDIQRDGIFIMAHTENRCLCQIVDMQKFALRRSRPPDGHFRVAPDPGFMCLSDKRRDDMAGFQVEIITRPVNIGRHQRNRVEVVLLAIRRAHFQPRNLGNCVGFVRRLQFAGQQVFFPDRLRRMFGIDTGRAEEQQLGHATFPRRVDQIGLYREIVIDELRRLDIIGVDAAHLCRRDKNEFRFFIGEEPINRRTVPQVQFRACACNQVRTSIPNQCPGDGGTNQPAMAGNEDT